MYKSEQIAEIKWTVTGKVSDVIRTAGSQKPDLHFDYDDMGQRIAKTVTNKNVTTGDKIVTTYYVRDPQSNSERENWIFPAFFHSILTYFMYSS